MIAMLAAAILVAPGTLLGLDAPSRATYYDQSGIVIMRDALPGSGVEPMREIVLIVRTDCVDYDPLNTPEGVADRWDMRWKTVDAFELRGPRELEVIAEDPAGQWRRSCRVSDVMSCYAKRADDWIAEPAWNGGADQEAPFADVVASLVAWDVKHGASPSVYPCTRAKFTRGVKNATWTATTR